MAFDDNNLMAHLHVENTEIARTAMTEIEAETATIDLEENINETTDHGMIDHRVIGREAIAHTGIDHHFVATATETNPAAIDLLTEATMTDPKATDLLTEATTIVPKVTARRTKVVAVEIDPLTEATATDPKVIDHPIVAAAEIVPAAVEAVIVAAAAAVGSGPAAAADVQVAAVADLGPAVVAEGPHSEVPVATDLLAETNIKPVKKARVTKPKQQI